MLDLALHQNFRATLTALKVYEGTLDFNYPKADGGSVSRMTDVAERQMIREIQGGNKDGISELVRIHSDRLFAMLYRMTGSRFQAEDLLQETWVKVIRKIHTFNPEKEISPWLTQIAVNCCRDHWRRRRLRLRLPFTRFFDDNDYTADVSGPDSSLEPDDSMDIDRALKTISHKLREVIVLKFYSGFTYDEIAHILGIPAGTVKSRLHLALEQLRNFFQEVNC